MGWLMVAITPMFIMTLMTSFAFILGVVPLVLATGAGYIEVLKASYAEDSVRDAFYRAKRESRPYVLCVASMTARAPAPAFG